MSSHRNIVRRLAAAGSLVYLTFDDGPDPDYTPRVLDVLAEARARATFFVVGTAAVRYPALVRRMLAEEHEVANHTWSHAHPWRIRGRAARHEVHAATAALADLTGQCPNHFRPPFGRLRRAMTEAAHEAGQTVVLWSLSGKDWGPLGHAAVIAKRLARARAGDIILLHDARWRYNRPWEMLEVLSAVLGQLEKGGIKLGLMDRSPSSACQAGRTGAPALP